MSKPMAPEHEPLLRTALKLGENDPLPEDVIEMYWNLTRTMTRLGERVSVRDLAWIVVLRGQATESDPVSFLSTAIGLKTDHRVLASFKNEWRYGRYRGLKGKKVSVVVDGDTMAREFIPTNVRLPDREELAQIGE